MRHGPREDAALVAPGVLLLLAAFFFPIVQMLLFSLEPSDGAAPSAEQFVRFLTDPYYLGVAWRTLKLSVIITALCIAIGFPLAYVMARVGPRLRLWLIVLTVLPLMTSVVVRTFGWIVIMSRGGPLTDVLSALGLASPSFMLLHTETAIVVAMVQVLLPFMTLTTLGVMLRIDPRLEEAARTMGCSFFAAVRTVILPLSTPGIVSGSLLVFALSISSFITPSLVGGVRLPVLATSIYQQAIKTLDWPFAAAQSVILLTAVLVILIPYMAAMRRAHGDG